METNVLKNAWYAVAWAHEVGREIIERTILGDSLVVFRQLDGTPTVMSNRCPHRFAPLHLGKLVDDCVECPYHGLRFNAAGSCAHNPHGEPLKAQLTTYPIMEKYEMIWIWPGDPDRANEQCIADFSNLSRRESGFQTVSGTIEMEAHYELVSDNLLDLTHATFVHEGSLGSEAMLSAEKDVEYEGSTVWSKMWCPNGIAPPTWDFMLEGQQGKPVDHWLYIRWDAPGHMLLDVGLTPPGGTRADGSWMLGTNILTPISDTRTRYFWALSRNFNLDDPELDAATAAGIQLNFEQEDKVIVEAQQQQMGGKTFRELGPKLMATDAGSIRSRRILRRLVESDEVPNPAESKLANNMSTVKDLDRVEKII